MRTCSLAEGAADAAPVLDSMLPLGRDGEDHLGEVDFGERRDALVQVACGAMKLAICFAPDDGVAARTDRRAERPEFVGYFRL